MIQKTLSPDHYQLIEPLVKWKILSLDSLMELIHYKGGRSNYYKKITSLEQSEIIGSFIDNHCKQKYIYLKEKGMQHLGEQISTPINSANINHDALSSHFSFYISGLPFTKQVIMEHEIIKKYPMIKHRPDALFECHCKALDIRLAFELELTAKSKERVLEIFSYYDCSNFFNNVLFVFNHEYVFNKYIKLLEESTFIKNKDRFIFQLADGLHKRIFSIEHNRVIHRSEEKTLADMFSVKLHGENTVPVHLEW